MNAIPTKYAGVQMRSRLEAKWAAFFDLAAWMWEYEPFDLPGWIPDFYVWPSHLGGGFLVEVKPFFSLEEFDAEFYRKRLKNCGIPHCEGVALLGAAVQRYCLGRKQDAPEEVLEGAQLGWFLNVLSGMRAGHNYWHTMPPEYRYQPDAPNALFLGCYAEGWEGEEMWREAGNRVQWKAPR